MAIFIFFFVHGFELDDFKKAAIFAGAGLSEERVAGVGYGEENEDYQKHRR